MKFGRPGKPGREKRRSRNKRKKQHRAKFARDRVRRDRFEPCEALAAEIDAADSLRASLDRQLERN